MSSSSSIGSAVDSGIGGGVPDASPNEEPTLVCDPGDGCEPSVERFDPRENHGLFMPKPFGMLLPPA
jgi:hypothetical protein